MHDATPPPGRGTDRPRPPHPGWTPAAPPYGGRATPAGAPPVPAGPPPLATWGQRVGGFLLDALAFNVILGAVYFLGMLTNTFVAMAVDYEAMNTPGEVPTSFMAGTVVVVGLAVVAAWCYLWIPLVTHGRTLGKAVVGTAVVRLGTGERPRAGRAMARATVQVLLGYGTAGLGALVDGLWPRWDRRAQALHDKPVGTIVVQRPV